MNLSYYEHIYEQFSLYHPYIAKDVDDYRPRGENGIRVTLVDGTEYDFYITSKSIRKVDDRPTYDHDEIQEEQWRALLADRLQERMIMTGFTQQTLAEYTGLGKGSIYNYVNGKATPSGYALSRLARALDCTIAELTE